MTLRCLDELRIALSTRSAHIQTILLESIADVSPPSTALPRTVVLQLPIPIELEPRR